MRALLTIAIACAAACGGSRGTAPQAPPRHDTVASPESRSAHDEPPSAAECAALVAHAIDLVERERTDGTKLADADRANVQALADARCRTMPRAGFGCALAAMTVEALAACDAPQSKAAAPSR